MKVGLVLGGGGARGFAHLGVLRAMEERGIVPEAITGCSMGGIIGALVANGGTSKTIHTIFDELNWLKIMDRARMGALIGGNGIAAQLDRHLPDSFSELSIPLRVNAVDVQEGRAVTFWEGDLVSALRATSALPGVFSPVERDGRVFVDGGLLNNVPLGDIRTMTHAPVLAVDVTVPPNRKLVFRDNRDFWEKLKEPIRVGKRPLIFELLIKSYDIPAAALTDIQIAAFRPQILVRPKLDPDLKVEDFKRMEEAIAAGYEEATAVLDAQEDRGRNVDPS